MYDSSSEEEVQEVILVQRPRNFRLRNIFNFHAEYDERFPLKVAIYE
jgi:hypothetical protein